MDASEVSKAADDLYRAQQNRIAIEPLTSTYGAISVDDAYQIQLANISKRLAQGATVTGHKVGLSAKAMQRMLGVNEPDYGHLLDTMFAFENTELAVNRLLQPRVEIEVAFVLKARLEGPGVSVADVVRATDFVLPSIEVVDSRIANWKITLADTIADNASSGMVVLGGSPSRLDDLDIRLIGASLLCNGRVREVGASGAVLGNPAVAVAWLANKVAGFGVALEPGHVIMPGSCTRMIPVGPGDVVRAEFDRLGYVSASFCSEHNLPGVSLPRPSAAIVGSGNIGTDLMFKLLRSNALELRWMIGVDPASEGLKLARSKGLETSHDGVDWLLSQPELPDIVFEATSAYVHVKNAPRYREAGIRAVDLTPAAVGPYVIPPANLTEHIHKMNVNMVTCGGQATIPMVYAVSRVVPVPYAEIVATVSSRSAGPGTRHNIDEFTRTTAAGVVNLGRAERGKAIIILNPAEPPMMMQNTIYCAIPEDADEGAIADSIDQVAGDVASYVPGYRLRQRPQFDTAREGRPPRVTVFVEVEGAGDYLPPYAGNLDIMTAAATKVGEEIARSLAVAVSGTDSRGVAS